MMASCRRHLEVMELLLRQVADADINDNVSAACYLYCIPYLANT